MKLNLKRILILSTFVILEFASLFLMYKPSTDIETKLEDVRLRETSTIKKNTFAIMLEQSDGTYSASNSNAWPTNMEFNGEKSGCIDANGNEVENGISYNTETKMVKVRTNGSTYCYLYFDLDKIGPVITNVVDAGDGRITFTVTDELNEVSQYCVNSSATDTSDCTWYDAIEGTQTTGTIVTDSGDYYVHVSDTIENIGHSSMVTIEISELVGEYILSNPSSGLDTSTPYNGMYRYTGTTADNYVSLDGVLYRIIGITNEPNSTLGLEAGQIKLMKAESIGKYNWHTSYEEDTKWESSTMYTYLHGSSVLGSTSIIPSGWSDKIDSVKWHIGDVQSYTNANTIIGLEDDSVTSSTSKIGLMYMSDYYYANTAGGTTNCYSSCSNWMTLGSNEWTMTSYGMFGFGNYRAWRVNSGGDIGRGELTGTYAVRPVFYLNNDVRYVSGTGTSTNPFIIK